LFSVFYSGAFPALNYGKSLILLQLSGSMLVYPEYLCACLLCVFLVLKE
jgi:hypothetical protein